MPDGELNVTLGTLSLSSDAEPSGDIVRAVLANISLSSEGRVLLYGALATTLDAITSVASGGVEVTGALAVTLGGVSAETFGTSLNGTTAPYEDVISWTGHPLTGSLVRVRTGKLFGIFGEPNEFGLFAGEGWDASSGATPSTESKYIRLGSFTNEFHNVPINLYDDGDITMQMEPDAPSFAMGSPIPSGYATGIGLWQGKDTDDIYKWRVGDPSVGGSMLSWNGGSLSLVNSSLDISGATAHLAFGNPPPTAATVGTGIWIDRTGFYGINDDVTQIFIDTLDGVLYIEGGTEFGANPILGSLAIVGDLKMLGGTIQIGATNPNIILADENIIGYTSFGDIWYMLGLDMRGHYGISPVAAQGDHWGMGIGDSNAIDDYLRYYKGALTIKGSLTAGNNNVFIDEEGIIVTLDAELGHITPLIRYGETRNDINVAVSGFIGTDNVTGDILAYGNDVGGIDVETDLVLRAVSGELAKSTLKAANLEADETIVATVTAQTDSTSSSVIISANSVIINGGSVQASAISGGIPMANALGKIDQSWLPDAEEEVETGEYTVPGGAMVLWDPDTIGGLPSGWSYVTGLDGYFAMGHSANDLSTARGSATHTHTNPSVLSSGAHNNHPIAIDRSSNADNSDTTAYIADDDYIVGQHVHGGTGSNESTSGAHTHTSGNTGSASNMPAYKVLRWIKSTTNIDAIAPIGAIVMQATGTTMGSDWKVCNGTNGTVDMTDLFVYANSSGSTGGSNTHSHTSGATGSGGAHTHTVDVLSDTTPLNSSTSNNGWGGAVGSHKHTKTGATSAAAPNHTHSVGTSGTASSKPPHIILQFWQRMTNDAEDYFPVGTVMVWSSAADAPSTYRDFTEANGFIPKAPASGESIGATFGTAYGFAHYHTSGALVAASAHVHAASASIQYGSASGNRPWYGHWTTGNTTTITFDHYHTFTFTLGAGGAHTHTLSSVNTGSTTALPPHKYVRYIVREFISGTPQTYIKSADTPTDHAIVRFNGTTGDSVQDSLATIDDSGNMVVEGTIKDGDGNEYGRPVFLATPLTSTSWDGDSFSTAGKTLIDLSSVFGVPAGVKAVIASVSLRDSGSAGSSSGCYLILSPNSTSYNGVYTYCAGLANDAWTHHNIIVPCNANGDVYYQINASGSSTAEIYLQIFGYWL